MAQIDRLVEAGVDIVRVAVPGIPDADALPELVERTPVPVIADIHFNASLALRAIDAGVAAVRINPGNIGGPDKVEQVVRRAQERGTPMRIGANSGLSARAPALDRDGGPLRRARPSGHGGGRDPRAARVPRVQDLGEVELGAGHDRGLPPPLGARAVPAPPRRDRGRDRVHGHRQERRRHRRRCSRRASATRSASRSRPIPSRRSRRATRSSRRWACGSRGPSSSPARRAGGRTSRCTSSPSRSRPVSGSTPSTSRSPSWGAR